MRLTTFPLSENQRGFVLPVVLFGLVIMSTLAVAAMLSSSDELLSSRAMRTSSAAFYAAEAGLHETYATWSNYPAIDSIAPGDSLDLGWQTLANGASYRATVYRWDSGDEPTYQMLVEGRSPGAASAQKTLSLSLTSATGSGYMLGECCAATATVKGTFKYSGLPDSLGWGGNILHSGYDTHPPNWEDAGVCSDELYDKPGLIMADTSQVVDWDLADATLEGVPPILEDPTITDAVFDSFGEYSWQDIKDRATIIIDGNGNISNADGSIVINFDTDMPAQKLKGGNHIYPRYTTDPITGESVCDTNHPMNWGSDDPSDPCFDHFPIILIAGEVDMYGAPRYPRFYGQGIIIADFNEVAQTGSEIEFETGVEFRGLTMGKGCIEIQKGAQYYGSVFMDGTYDGVTCDKSADLYLSCKDGGNYPCEQTLMQWSQCAVDRAIFNSGLAEYAVPTNPGGAQLLGSRSFGEMF